MPPLSKNLLKLGCVLVPFLACLSSLAVIKKAAHSTYYDSIYHTMVATINEADFRSFYESISLDEHFPENLKYELILITTKRAKDLGFDHSYARGLFLQSIYKTKSREFGEAIQMASISLKILQKLEDHLLVSACYNTLGSTLTANGDPGIGKVYLRKAIKENKLAEHSKQKIVQQINNLIVLGYVYYNADQLDSAEVFTRQALRETNNTSIHENDEYNLFLEKAYCHINLGKFELRKGHYSEAIDLYKKGLEICKKGSYQDIQAIFYHRIGQAYNSIGDWRNSLLNFEAGIQICKSYFTFLPIWIDLLEIKSKTLEQTGNYLKALQVQKEFISLNDSINSINKEKELQRMVIEFHVQQKDQEIASLNQQAMIQSLKLSQRNSQLIGFGSLFLMATLGGFLYYRQFKFRKERAAFELEQRFLRSQMNPHFIFNSMTSIQGYLIRTDTENAENYMGMFSTLMRQILENSREEFIPLKKELCMLKNYIELQKLRFQESFDYIIEIDPSIDEDYTGIPPMFAQPFIENTFEHGLFRDTNKENMLKVRFSKKGSDQIILEVEDTGTGIEQVAQSKMHKSVATKITKERLQNLNFSVRDKYWIQSNNVVGENGSIEGYLVRLSLPTKIITYI